MAAVLEAANLPPEIIRDMLAVPDGKRPQKTGNLPVLVNQAEAARLASVSRFTIRKMVAAGKLHPVEVLPGLIRFRVEEILSL